MKKWKNKKAKDGFQNRKWEEHIRYIVRDMELVETAKSQIKNTTRTQLGRLWMQNWALNLPKIRASDKCLRSIASEKVIHTPAIVIGGGPSVFRNKHLEQLAKSDFKGIVLATDRMLIPALKAGVKVDYVVSVDGNATLIPPFFDDPIVEGKGIKALMVGTTHPNTVAACEKRGLEIYWYEVNQDNPDSDTSSTRSLLYMTMSEKNPGGIQTVPSGGNCGCTAIAIAIDVLKNYRIALIGFDYGYGKDTPLDQTSYYSSMLVGAQKAFKGEPILISSAKCASIFTSFHHPVFKTDALTDVVWDNYRVALYDILSNEARGVKIINCTEGGTLYCPRIFSCMRLQEFLSQERVGRGRQSLREKGD